jgi:DNA-binding NarL/FixJ family response regulator
MINVGIVDDKQYNRVSLSEKMQEDDMIKILFLASNGEDCLAKLKESKILPDVILMDIDMPVLNGIETVNIAHEVYPSIKFLMLTVFDDDEKIFEAIKAGAVGYLLKDENTLTIIESVKQIIENGAAPMSPRIARKALNLLMQADLKFNKDVDLEKIKLTEREKDILKLIVDGLEYRAIADKLFISPNTVRTHFGNIYEKLHVCNKAQVIKLAIKNRWFIF